jgi:hypothetical protein
MSYRHSTRALARRSSILLVLVLAALALLAGVTTAAVTEGTQPVSYKAPGGAEVGLRPTGVGLPSIGESGTVGAGELVNSLREYYESGAYAADLTAVDGSAEAFLNGYSTSGKAKPALVLDIDETSLSNYAGLLASGFTEAGLAATSATGTATAIAPTLTLYRDAIAHRVAVFFVTGRPSELQSITEANLRDVGYDEGWSGLYFKPTEADTEAFKSSTRKAIDKSGYRIVVNVGDQQSDLDGGYAVRDFKLPDPFYYIPD